MKKIFTVILLLFFSLFLNIKVSAAENINVSLIVSTPGEDAEKDINITWHSTGNDNFVRYTLAADVGFSSATYINATAQSVPAFQGNMPADTKQYKAYLKNLQKDTKYIYQVGNLLSWSKTHQFQTAGADNFSFIHISDIHSYNPSGTNTRVNRANSLLNTAYSMDNNIRMVFLSGDAAAWGTYYNQWRDLFAMDTVSQMMYALTPGNHDYYNNSATTTNLSYFNSVTNHPDNGAVGLINSTYYFKYGNTLFISLESEAASASSTHVVNQQNWLRNVLANNPAEFVVVQTHRPFYTGDGRNAEQAASQRRFFQDIFDEYGVDLVLTGHNHVQARTKSIYEGRITTTPSGTVYLVNSAVGDRWQTAEGSPMATIDYYKVGSFDACTIISVEGHTMNLKTINSNGTVLDTYQIKSKMSNVNKQSYCDSISLDSKEGDYTKATLQFDNLDPGVIKNITVKNNNGGVVLSKNAPVSPLTLTGIPADEAFYDLNVLTTLRDGEIINKTFTLINPDPAFIFGSIENLRIEDQNLEHIMFLWDSDIIEDRVERLEIYINGILFSSLLPTDNEVLLEDINPFTVNQIELRAINGANRKVYAGLINYGSVPSPVEIWFADRYLKLNAGEEKIPELIISPDQDIYLKYSSSDENVAVVDEQGKITAIGNGECVITVTAYKRTELTDTIQIIVTKAPDEDIVTPPDKDPDEKGKQGCFGSLSISFTSALAFMFLLFRKNRVK